MRMLNYAVAQEIYTQTRKYNLEIQQKISELADFKWDPWPTLDPVIRQEYLSWTNYLFMTGNFAYSVEQRHAFAIANRISGGWILEEKRNDELKHDPYLLPMEQCPEWLFEWCENKDRIMIQHVRNFLEYYEKIL